jgi:hypothetical protein
MGRWEDGESITVGGSGILIWVSIHFWAFGDKLFVAGVLVDYRVFGVLKTADSEVGRYKSFVGGAQGL